MSSPETPRPGAWLRPAPTASAVQPASGDQPTGGPTPQDLATRLAGLPVAEHADVLAAEHDRLHRLLGTVDQL